MVVKQCSHIVLQDIIMHILTFSIQTTGVISLKIRNQTRMDFCIKVENIIMKNL